MKQFPQLARSPWFLAFAAALAAVALYAAAGFWLLPRLAEHYAPRLAETYLKRSLSVSEVRFNPFRFSLELKGFALGEPDGANLLSFQRLSLNFDPTGLARKTLVFPEFLIEKPSVAVIVDADGRLNFQKIADELPHSEASEQQGGELLHVYFKHFAVADGTVKFSDRSRGEPFEETLDSIDFEIEDLSTLPDVQGRQRVTAQFGRQGTLDWQGMVSVNPLYSEGQVVIEKFPLASLWPWVKDRIGIAEPEGDLGLSAHYRLSEGAGGLSFAISHTAAEIVGLKLVPEGGGEPLLALDRIELAEADFDLESRKLHVPRFDIRKGRVRAAIDGNGEIDWLKLSKPDVSAAETPASDRESSSPWRVEVEALKIAEIGIDYADASRNSPIGLGVGGFGLSLAAAVEAGSGEPKVVVSDLSVRLENIALTASGGEALARLDSATVEGGHIDLSQREIAAEKIELKGGGTAIVRDASGGIRLAEALKSAPSAEVPSHEQDGAAWRYALQQFVLQDFGVAVADRSYTPEIAYQLDGVRLSLGPVASGSGTPSAFDAAFAVKQGGAFQSSGTISPNLDRADAEVRIDKFDLKPLRPLVAQFSALQLESADVSAQLQLGYRREADTALKAKGDVSIGGLLLKETASGKRFLSWKDLTADDIDFSLEQGRLAVKEVRAAAPGWNLEIYEDRSTNIEKIFAGGAQAKAAERTPKASKSQRRQDQAKPFLVTVESVRVAKGDIDFSDMSLVLPFATHIHDFLGAATGLSSRPAARTMLQFHGQVDRYGEVNVFGELSPLEPKNFGDVSVAFRNVDMPSLSPYSATFAGREITSGKLGLDIRYRIDDGKLKNDNRIVLERFALGESVESPKAVSLPLDLAIALLTDGDGRIDVSVPVEGDLGNPRFDYGKVIWDAFVNVVTKTVTAPFRALGRLFGGDGEEMGAVLFEPGSAAIEPPELEKLNRIEVALAKRPQLSLEVYGGFDPELDGRALKSLQVRRALAAKLEFRLLPGEEPGPIPFDSAASQLALEDLAKESGGSDAVDQVQVAFEKSAGRKADRVGRMAALTGKPSADTAFYRALFEHLVETAPLPPEALETLAGHRAQAVFGELKKLGGSGTSRVTVGKAESGESRDKRVVTRLDLSAAGD